MKLKDSAAIALADFNNFYVSCERAFDPKLLNKPVAVLSNNDGCVISRSNEVKALGVRMGAPLFECERLLEKNDALIYSSNYELYGDLSERAMSLYETFSPEVEIYSVDEAFLGLNETSKGFDYVGREIQEKIFKWLNIPVGIGIAETKTLAKIANKIAKKSEKAKGVLDLYKSPYTDLALERTEVGDVWEIGKRTVEKLSPYGVRSALDFKNLDLRIVKKMLTVKGGRTLLELRGQRCYPLELEPPPKKNVTSSGSFSQPVETRHDLYNAVSCHLETAVAKIRKHRLSARVVTVFIQTNPFQPENYYGNSFTYKSNYPSDNIFELQEWTRNCFERVYRAGCSYRKVEINLLGLIPNEGITGRLYDTDPQKEKLDRINRAMDEINKKFGRHTVHLASAKKGAWQMKRDRLSPRYTTRIGEIIRIK